MARFLKLPSKCDVTSRKSGSHKLRNVKRHEYMNNIVLQKVYYT